MFSRYSDPLKLIDIAIYEGRLCRLIDRIITSENIKTAWEIWLNKETGKSWNDMMLLCVPQELYADKNEIEEIERSLMKGGVFV